MKKLRLLPLLAALAVSALSASAADAPPALTIDQALKIAQDYLQQHGAAADHQIVGLTLEKATMHSIYWYARWSPSIVAENTRKETGLRIEMDGSITRFVTAPGGGNELPVGQRPQGARNMR
jgi:hypothetical protein